ncbi:MAG: hypothetical protein AB8B96_06520 [Lysobacterales bacterium]
MARSFRSDLGFVMTRLLTLGLSFWLMARAIDQHSISPLLMVLPLLSEWLMIMWVGIGLSRLVISCLAFRSEVDRPGRARFWTIVLAALVTLALYLDGEGRGSQDWWTAIASGWGQLLTSGLLWIVLLEAVGLVLATVPDYRHWARAGGKFIWTASYGSGVRGAGLLVMVLFTWAALPLGLTWVVEVLADQPNGSAWVVFWMLVMLELTALGLTVWLHRDCSSNTGSAYHEENLVSPYLTVPSVSTR